MAWADSVHRCTCHIMRGASNLLKRFRFCLLPFRLDNYLKNSPNDYHITLLYVLFPSGMH